MKFIYSLPSDKFLEIYEEAIKLAKERGREVGSDIGDIFFEIVEKKGITAEYLGKTDKDIDLLTGDLREQMLKLINIEEEKRKKALLDEEDNT